MFSDDKEEVKLEDLISTVAARGCVEKWLVQVCHIIATFFERYNYPDLDFSTIFEKNATNATNFIHYPLMQQFYHIKTFILTKCKIFEKFEIKFRNSEVSIIKN